MQASPDSNKFPFLENIRVEEDLMAVFPRDSWAKLHLQFIYFGREHCQVTCVNNKLQHFRLCVNVQNAVRKTLTLRVIFRDGRTSALPSLLLCFRWLLDLREGLMLICGQAIYERKRKFSLENTPLAPRQHGPNMFA